MTLRRLTLLAIAVVILGAVLTYLREPPTTYWPTGQPRHRGEGEVGNGLGEVVGVDRRQHGATH